MYSTDIGTIRLKTPLHLYKYRELAAFQAINLHQKIKDVLELKNQGKKIDSFDWNKVKTYVLENDDHVWVKNIATLEEFLTKASCFAIRSNCIENPFECLEIYKQRGIVETAFRQMKFLNGNNRLRCTESTYVAQSPGFIEI